MRTVHDCGCAFCFDEVFLRIEGVSIGGGGRRRRFGEDVILWLWKLDFELGTLRLWFLVGCGANLKDFWSAS